MMLKYRRSPNQLQQLTTGCRLRSVQQGYFTISDLDCCRRSESVKELKTIVANARAKAITDDAFKKRLAANPYEALSEPCFLMTH